MQEAREVKEALDRLLTEARNPATLEIDRWSTREIVRKINEEDQTVAAAVATQLDAIAQAVDRIVASLLAGGRLFYVGAGTSGRLGVLDAAECPPTFGTDPQLVQAVMAGGERAWSQANEGAEDDEAAGEADLRARGLTSRDVVVGITASGRTPYVIGALKYAGGVGATTIGLACNPNPPIAAYTQVAIVPVTGPEVIMGSTRMKAGTAQKMVLNMLSTVTMIRLGKVYSNLMVDMRSTNEKLRRRSVRMIELATGASEEECHQALAAAGGESKVAIVTLLAAVDAAVARRALEQAQGRVREALQLLHR